MITKRIVESMDGDITVESTQGKGTKFIIHMMVQVNNDIIKEDESIHTIQMEKIKPDMIALGNNLLQGGILAVASAYFEDSPKVAGSLQS